MSNGARSALAQRGSGWRTYLSGSVQCKYDVDVGPFNVTVNAGWRKVGLNHAEQTGEWVRIFLRFLWYTGVAILVSSIAVLAVRFWLPESSHMPLFILVHSLCIGVALMLLIRSVASAKTGPALHKESSANQSRDGEIGCGCLPTDRPAGVSASLPRAASGRVFSNH